DALGASESFFAAGYVAKYKYLGRSLERVSFDVPASEVVNWAPSPPDGATPGRRNATAGNPLPIVEHLTATRKGTTETLIGKDDDVTIAAQFSARGTVAGVEVEYRVETLDRS